jgi:hypothetical protein
MKKGSKWGRSKVMHIVGEGISKEAAKGGKVGRRQVFGRVAKDHAGLCDLKVGTVKSLGHVPHRPRRHGAVQDCRRGVVYRKQAGGGLGRCAHE